jgi:hypothetical protein
MKKVEAGKTEKQKVHKEKYKQSTSFPILWIAIAAISLCPGSGGRVEQGRPIWSCGRQ